MEKDIKIIFTIYSAKVIEVTHIKTKKKIHIDALLNIYQIYVKNSRNSI